VLRFSALVLFFLALPVRAGGPLPEVRQQVADAAIEAQTRCYRLIHHDTFAYAACLRGMLQEETKPTPRRLGIEYFGFVGALNSARLGMLGAETSAWEFLQRFRLTQKKLRFDDASLCGTIAGDCEVRIARMQQMAAAPRPRPADAAGADDGHRHAH